MKCGPIYAKYASPLLKSVVEAEPKASSSPVTSGGKIYGVPQEVPSANGLATCRYREDWLKKLNLERPKTRWTTCTTSQTAFASGIPIAATARADTIVSA